MGGDTLAWLGLSYSGLATGFGNSGDLTPLSSTASLTFSKIDRLDFSKYKQAKTTDP